MFSRRNDVERRIKPNPPEINRRERDSAERRERSSGEHRVNRNGRNN